MWFFFSKTRFTLLKIWRIPIWAHQFHIKKKKKQDSCQFNMISGRVVIPFPVPDPGKEKQSHWEWYWNPSLFDLAKDSSAAIVCCVFQHELLWSVEDIKTQSEAKDNWYLLSAYHARYSWLSLSILRVALWGKHPNTHFTNDETESLRLVHNLRSGRLWRWK